MSKIVSIEMAGIEGVVKALEDDIVGIIRPAAQAAAQVVYEQARANVSRIKRKTGNLYNSIYQWYDTKESTPTLAVYKVSWRTKGKGGPRAPHGHLVEYGHFLRYKYYRDKDGRAKIMVRPEMRGKPWPKTNASRAEKDAYFVLSDNPEERTVARPFMRSVPGQVGSRPAEAARKELFERLKARRGQQAVPALIQRGAI